MPRRSAHMLVTFVALALGLVGACGPGPSRLDGSLGQVYDIRFDQTRVRLYEGQLSIEYVRRNGAVPVRVGVHLDPESRGRGGVFTIGEDAELSGSQPDGASVPTAQDGEVRLDAFEPRHGARVSGSFRSRIIAGGREYTLHGDFNAPLDDVSWPDGGPLDAGDSG